MHLVFADPSDSTQANNARCKFRKLWLREKGVPCRLLHAYECGGRDCDDANCAERCEMIRQHTDTHHDPYCFDCQIMQRVVLDHAKFCKFGDKCPVPSCDVIRGQMREMRQIRRQQHRMHAIAEREDESEISCSDDDSDYEPSNVGCRNYYEELKEELFKDDNIDMVREIVESVYHNCKDDWHLMIENDDGARLRIFGAVIEAIKNARTQQSAQHEEEDFSSEDDY